MYYGKDFWLAISGLPRRADDPDDHHLRERGNQSTTTAPQLLIPRLGPIGPAEIAPTGGLRPSRHLTTANA